ncbi:hypothetical protein QE152_g1994 [Popillia japonica]|uniref:Uncharacterized protein n=1 Tax=Popillia japonica TaxID=7064 RepID=A0AAW1N0V3_POPJA
MQWPSEDKVSSTSTDCAALDNVLSDRIEEKAYPMFEWPSEDKKNTEKQSSSKKYRGGMEEKNKQRSLREIQETSHHIICEGTKVKMVERQKNAQRLRWLNARRMPKMVLSRKPIGRKRRRRPTTSWLETAEEDARRIGVQD